MSFTNNPAARQAARSDAKGAWLYYVQGPKQSIGKGQTRATSIWIHSTPQGQWVLTLRTDVYAGGKPFKTPESVASCFVRDEAEIRTLIRNEPVTLPSPLRAMRPASVRFHGDIVRIINKPMNDWTPQERRTAAVFMHENRPT